MRHGSPQAIWMSRVSSKLGRNVEAAPLRERGFGSKPLWRRASGLVPTALPPVSSSAARCRAEAW